MTDKKRRDACLRSTFLQDAIKALEEFQVDIKFLIHAGSSGIKLIVACSRSTRPEEIEGGN